MGDFALLNVAAITISIAALAASVWYGRNQLQISVDAVFAHSWTAREIKHHSRRFGTKRDDS
jgi:hypothetical protein